jgi:two-component system, chemotaxis family, chemotaxis protein CheY
MNHTNKYAVMIVDDDSVNNTVCTLIINRAQFANSVTAFTKATEALEYLQNNIKNNPSQLPDVIFLDINMPIMNGWDFLDVFVPLLPQYPKPLLLYMLSSSVYHEDMAKAKHYPIVSDYLPKPLNTAILNSIREKIGSGN